VVVEDICASGGYYVAAAADQIYVDKASIVGSIGVVMDGFGFTGIMEKLGVERRAITAGENKRFLDPFAPLTAAHREYAEKMLAEIHQQFITVVRNGRGKRLKETPEVFSGLIWTGEKSIELGLADAIGNVESVARDVIKAEQVVDFTLRQNLAERVARKFGATMAEALVKSAGGGAQLR
jgi:protease-4